VAYDTWGVVLLPFLANFLSFHTTDPSPVTSAVEGCSMISKWGFCTCLRFKNTQAFIVSISALSSSYAFGGKALTSPPYHTPRPLFLVRDFSNVDMVAEEAHVWPSVIGWNVSQHILQPQPLFSLNFYVAS
jgi:hypothetical protein